MRCQALTLPPGCAALAQECMSRWCKAGQFALLVSTCRTRLFRSMYIHLLWGMTTGGMCNAGISAKGQQWHGRSGAGQACWYALATTREWKGGDTAPGECNVQPRLCHALTRAQGSFTARARPASKGPCNAPTDSPRTSPAGAHATPEGICRAPADAPRAAIPWGTTAPGRPRIAPTTAARGTKGAAFRSGRPVTALTAAT